MRLEKDDAFWAKVQRGKPDECWPWTGGGMPQGYGHFQTGSGTDGTRKTWKAHRYAWTLLVGPIPDGLHLCHHCDNPPCVNPAHMFIGTHRENNADKVAKMRQARGETFSIAKLTE